MNFAEVKALIEALPPKDYGRLIHSFSGARDGAEEFPELWPSIIGEPDEKGALVGGLTEDEKTELRLSLGFPR